MAIQGISSAGLQGVSGAGGTPKVESFKNTLKAQTKPGSVPVRTEGAPQPQVAEKLNATQAKAGKTEVKAPQKVGSVENAKAQSAPVKVVDQVAQAQKRMESVLELAQSGKSFSPAELLALQSQMYRASQELDLAGKVIEKATGGVKQVLQTQV